jgi:trehalose 6-phosphate phosphatase
VNPPDSAEEFPSIRHVGSPDWMRRWPDVQARIITRPRLLLAAGFDGLFSRTEPGPVEAALPTETHVLLSKLSLSRGVTLAILSGRSLNDIQSRVQLPGAIYVGNHGMEICGQGWRSSDGLAESCRADLVDALAFLARYTKRLRGVLVEDKGLAVTVHWRQANPGEGAAVRDLLDVVVRGHPRLKIFAGEACWELRARASWSKGDALQQILSHLHLTPADTICIGEESTDEDAFARLAQGLTFSVGTSRPSSARYSLEQWTDVAQLLFCIFCAVHRTPLR